MLAEALLDAESKIGEILSKSSSKGTFKKGGETSLPQGISKKQSHYFQQMAKHPDVVEQVKAEAREEDDLATRTEVIRRIKQEQAKEHIQDSDIKMNTDGRSGFISIPINK